MNKKMMVLFIIVFSFFGMIRSNEVVVSGDALEMYVNIVNSLGSDLDDVRVRMFIYDLGVVVDSDTFDVDGKDNAGRLLFWETGGAPAGDYLVRITASNDDFRNVKYRYITII